MIAELLKIEPVEFNLIRVCLAGATGWVGRALSPAIVSSPDLKLVGAVSRSSAGKDLGTILSIPKLSLMISPDVGSALEEPTDVLVDYTSAESVKGNILSALTRRVHVVVGSSGLSNEDYQQIEDAAIKNSVGIIAAGNFAISAALLLHFAELSAKFMPSWEIVDYASASKIDAPSGTARELAFRLSQIGTAANQIDPRKVSGLPESRGVSLNGTQVHSIRLPSFIVAAEVIFGKTDERLSLRYEAGTGPEPYIEGTLLAIRRVIAQIGLVRGLDRLLDFEKV